MFFFYGYFIWDSSKRSFWDSSRFFSSEIFSWKSLWNSSVTPLKMSYCSVSNSPDISSRNPSIAPSEIPKNCLSEIHPEVLLEISTENHFEIFFQKCFLRFSRHLFWDTSRRLLWDSSKSFFWNFSRYFLWYFSRSSSWDPEIFLLGFPQNFF